MAEDLESLAQPILEREDSSQLDSGRDAYGAIGSTPLARMAKFMPLPPEDSVYSYLLFMPPIEQRRTKKYATSLTMFAVVLVFVNFVMQAGLLYVVGQHIMHKHVEWVSILSNLKNPAWYHVLPMAYNREPPKCHGKDSPLCFEHGDGISCSPLSVHLLADWKLLDSDGDGMWTRQEAEDKSLGEKIQCEYNVDLPSLYANMVAQINGSEMLQGRRDPSLLAGTAVRKAYADWYLHKPVLCQYGDEDMCGSLFERGVFDAALLSQPSSEFKDVTSALKYCHHILRYECFDILPTTYRVWRNVANQQCGVKFYDQSVYQNPANIHTEMPMLSVDFKKRREYATTKDPPFRLFLCILLTTFLSVMALEIRSISKMFTWCAMFPADDRAQRGRHSIIGKESVNLGSLSLKDGEEQKHAIKAVRTDHRCVVFLVTCLRLMLWLFLLWSGIMFLTGPPRYLTMIFDALSLVFIMEIDELLYRTMLRTEFKNDHMNIEDMEVPQWHSGVFSGNMNVVFDICSVFAVIACAGLIVYTFTQNELNPLLESLECLCSVQGSRCYEAQHYSKEWWQVYWSRTLPASKAIIESIVQ